MRPGSLFDEPLTVNQILASLHYLGPTTRGEVYHDDLGVMVFANPSSRRLPQQQWKELVRWCIVDRTPNAGSRQWRRVRQWLIERFPEVTTVVSYSDPSAGHTGALYRACNWLWAPTWHRLRTPPSGNGSWGGKARQDAKDRWVFPLRQDQARAAILQVQDSSLLARYPYAQFVENKGGDYKRWQAERARLASL